AAARAGIVRVTARGGPSATLFPYTTLFRSRRHRGGAADQGRRRHPRARSHRLQQDRQRGRADGEERGGARRKSQGDGGQPAAIRSEEHTSELQSRENLVCRLLREKKKGRIA